MNVANIVVHPKAQEQLDSLIRSPAHAIVLNGSTGIGKTHIARTMAASLLDIAEPQLTTHGYFRVVSPIKGSITIESIRELIGFFRLKVPGSAIIRRVAIIEDAETMGIEAQNALLKLLEEPPKDSVLLLTSSQPQLLLATVRSRLQTITLPGPRREALIQHFRTLNFDTDKIETILLKSGTNIASATAFLQSSTEIINEADVVLGQVKQTLASATYERLLLIDKLTKQKEAALVFTNTLANVAMVSLESAARKGSANVNRWKDILSAAQTAQEAFEHSGNAKLVLTELMLAL